MKRLVSNLPNPRFNEPTFHENARIDEFISKLEALCAEYNLVPVPMDQEGPDGRTLIKIAAFNGGDWNRINEADICFDALPPHEQASIQGDTSRD